MKKILIAIPTNKYIEPETFKSIYDLYIPDGYSTEFQFFHGYCIDQVRNLVAEWAKSYDYLFAVDSDMEFPSNTLYKLLECNADIVSGLYIQRKPGEHILELYRGGKNVQYEDICGKGIVEIDSCGFGCVLIKSEVFRSIPYPHFEYHQALDHKDTISEDVDFCTKARNHGFRIVADTSIRCNHIGSTKFVLKGLSEENNESNHIFDRLLKLSDQRLLPQHHLDYLYEMRDNYKIQPKVIYDIGACVLHWTREAVNVWPDAKIIPFEAMGECRSLYEHFNVQDYYIGVLGEKSNELKEFHYNPYHPGGNSFFEEKDCTVDKETITVRTARLDDIVGSYPLPYPDMIKMDVQGAELEILKGATKCLEHCKDIILEAQHNPDFNIGAPCIGDIARWLFERGFTLIDTVCDNGKDADYHFSRV